MKIIPHCLGFFQKFSLVGLKNIRNCSGGEILYRYSLGLRDVQCMISFHGNHRPPLAPKPPSTVLPSPFVADSRSRKNNGTKKRSQKEPNEIVSKHPRPVVLMDEFLEVMHIAEAAIDVP